MKKNKGRSKAMVRCVVAKLAVAIRPKKFQFLKKGKIVISVKNPKLIL